MGLLERKPITPRSLYEYARKHGLEDERIRISDGMAVSYFPTDQAMARSKNKMVIDVSCEPCYDWDDLSADDQSMIYRDGFGGFMPPLIIPDEVKMF